MKRLKYLLSLGLLFFLGISFVDAASFSIKANKSTVVVGNTVTITVSVSGSDAFGWEYCLNYDTSVFSLSSANSDTGGKCVKTGSSMTGYKTVNFKLKAKKSGSSKFYLSGAAIYDDDLKVITSSANSITVKAKTQEEIEASYSTNANLSSLKIDGYELSPDFNKDTLKYYLEVENDVEKITIRAGKEDSSASLSGTGEKELTEGVNKFSIVVTAEKGNKKTYVIEVNRKELNPIFVEVDGDEYTLVRKAEVIEAPTYYAATEIEIDGEVIPALKSEITGYVLVGLKDEAGDIKLYSYDELAGTYKLYKQIGSDGYVIIPIETSEIVDDYDKLKKMTINNTEVDVYRSDNDSSFVLLYGMNASTGDTNWYRYDTLDETFQRYEKREVEVEEESMDLYFILTIVFAGVSALTIIIMIVLMVMNSKLKKNNNRLIEMLENMQMAEAKKFDLDDAEATNTLDELDDQEKDDLEEDDRFSEPLSKRELRRMEKEQALKDEAELREMQEDFLKTMDSIEVDSENNEEENQEKTIQKKKRGRKRK